MRKRAISMFSDSRPPISSSDDEEASVEDDVNLNGTAEEVLSADGWTVTESTKLLELVQAKLPKKDALSYTRRLNSLDYSTLLIGEHTADEAKQHLSDIFKKLRHMRSVSELLPEAIEYVIKPPSICKRPLTAFQLFVQHYFKKYHGEKGISLQDASARYAKLNETEKKKYVHESAKLKLDYTSKMPIKEKKARAPKKQKIIPKKILSPFDCFAVGLRAEGLSEKDIRAKYQELNDKQKSIWIKKAVSKASKGIDFDLTTFLSKKDQLIFEGKPKAPLTAYNLFMKDYFQSADTSIETVKGNRLKEGAKFYKELDSVTKEKYKKEAELLKLEYTRDLANYMLNLPENHRDSFLESISNDKLDNSCNFTETYLNNLKSPVKSAESTNVVVSEKIQRLESEIKPVVVKRRKESTTEPETEEPKSKRKVITKVERKSPKKQLAVPEPGKFPMNAYRYYVEKIYKGKAKGAKKAYSRLTPTEKKSCKKQYRKASEEYMVQLEKYLKTLTKEEMLEYHERHQSEDVVIDSSESEESSSSDEE